MRILFRPHTGRLLCGVASAFHERYGIPLALLRFFFIAAFLVSPAIVLAYLLLAISIPTEIRVLDGLHFQTAETLPSRVRFEEFTSLLTSRTIGKNAGPAISPNFMGVLLLCFGAALELPNVEGVSFYAAHPFIGTFATSVGNIGSLLWYIAIAALFFTGTRAQENEVQLFEVRGPSFEFTENPRILGGIIARISRIVEIDPAYLRAIALLLNFLTLGVAGAAYLISWYLLRTNRANSSLEEETTASAPANISKNFRWSIALAFLLIAVMSICTALRLYFFNIPLFQSLIWIGLGLSTAWVGIAKVTSQAKLWIAGGAALFLMGIYGVTLSLTQVQLSIPTRMELAEVIAAIAALYFTLVALPKQFLRFGIGMTLVFGLAAFLIGVSIVPPKYLTEIYRFYTFFYPTIFAGIGLWIAFER